jgi:hypothetical protein
MLYTTSLIGASMFWSTQTAPQFSKDTMPKFTGKTYDEWVIVLNANNQRKKSLSCIMEYLLKEHGLSAAWARTIASYYILQ